MASCDALALTPAMTPVTWSPSKPSMLPIFANSLETPRPTGVASICCRRLPNAIAASLALTASQLSPCSTGSSAATKPSPSVALSVSTFMDSCRSWFAHVSDVLAASPCA